MSQQPLNLSPDIKELCDQGYSVEILDNHLLIHHVPYVNSAKEIKYGTLVSTLNQSGGKTLRPETHVIYFQGENPCNKDGSVITQIQHQSTRMNLTEHITIERSFSNKPPSGYPDYYAKMTRYVEIISAPAKSLDNSVSEKTFDFIQLQEMSAVFAYPDTNSTRAEIDTVTSKLKGHKIAIIGLGGTGGYVLDLTAKTPVKEIHLFDGDDFYQHNAFRAPGAAPKETFDTNVKKSDYFTGVYSQIHLNVISHPSNIDASNLTLLSSMDFVFICVDRTDMKKSLIEYLQQERISFIDVGMGVEKVNDQLIGIMRITSSTEKLRDHVANKNRIPLSDIHDQEYSKNIQMADLNALNAALAVVKWKKLCGFYQDLERENFTTYTINTNQLINEDPDA